MARSALLLSFAVFAGCGPASSTTAANCTTFTDLTTPTNAEIHFGGDFGFHYSPRCATVKVGQEITFSGDFTTHPLSQTSGTAGAIPHTTSGTTKTFTIPDAGIYDYQCDVHHAQGMTGALQVVP